MIDHRTAWLQGKTRRPWLRRGLRLLVLALALWTVAPGPVGAMDAPSPHKKVLVVHSYHQGCTWTDNIMAGIREVISEQAPQVEVYVEHLDVLRHKPREVFPELENLYRSKYGALGLDAIIVSDDPALHFLLARRARLFPGVPIVFCGVNDYTPAHLFGQGGDNITGVVENYDLAGTIALALRLHPDTRRVVALTDYSALASATCTRFWQIMPNYEDTIHFQRLVGRTPAELEEALRRLPDKTVLINLAFHYDKIGGQLSAKEVFDIVRESSTAPLYTLWDDSLQLGAVGGMVTSGLKQGQEAARLALQVLAKGSARGIPVVTGVPNVPMFDYRELKRFRLDGKILPPGAVILNKPLGLYDTYKREILTVALVVLGLVLLIVVLAASNISRRRALLALIRSQSRYRAIVENQTDFVVRFRPDMEISFANEAMLRFLNLPMEKVVGRSLDDFLSPWRMKAIRRLCAALTEFEPIFKLEQIFTPRNETRRWVKWTCLAIFDAQGRKEEYQAVGYDITEQKSVELAYRNSREDFRRLAMYQQDTLEAERAAISREIHDELGQNLTALNMGLNVLGRMVPDLPQAATQRVESMVGLVHEAITSVQQLSQNLRPAELDNLGLEAAMRWHMHYFQEHTGIEVAFECCGQEADALSPEQTTALYRVCQEALTNVARHAAAHWVHIVLARDGDAVTLQIHDNGRGISSEAVNSANSFGLIGMRERIRHQGGDVLITGEEGGTIVLARIPLSVDSRE